MVRTLRRITHTNKETPGNGKKMQNTGGFPTSKTPPQAKQNQHKPEKHLPQQNRKHTNPVPPHNNTTTHAKKHTRQYSNTRTNARHNLIQKHPTNHPRPQTHRQKRTQRKPLLKGNYSAWQTATRLTIPSPKYGRKTSLQYTKESPENYKIVPTHAHNNINDLYANP